MTQVAATAHSTDEPTTERRYTDDELRAREAEAVSITARDILAVLDRTLQAYGAAIADMPDQSLAARHAQAHELISSYSAGAKLKYAVDGTGRVRFYQIACDEPGCFRFGPKGPTRETAAAIARQAGWAVKSDNSYISSDARCPEHTPASG